MDPSGTFEVWEPLCEDYNRRRSYECHNGFEAVEKYVRDRFKPADGWDEFYSLRVVCPGGEMYEVGCDAELELRVSPYRGTGCRRLRVENPWDPA